MSTLAHGTLIAGPSAAAAAPPSPPGVTLAALEAALAELDVRLARTPADLELATDRAQFLELLGRRDEAVQAYVGVLTRAPTNPDALNALGLLCLSAGNRDGARTLLRGAVLHGETHAPAHANLGYVCLLDGELTAAKTLYERALHLDPQLAIAHHGLAEVFTALDQPAAAAEHRALGLRHRPVTMLRYRGDGAPVRVLVLGSAAFGNVATDGFFDDRVFAVTSLVVEYFDPALPLPPHDLIFNAVGEADLCGAALAAADAIVRRSGAPVVNHPAAVAATGRAANAARLQTLSGIRAPSIETFARSRLVAGDGAALLAQSGFQFPLLVRSPGHHTGDHFVKIDHPDDLPAAIAELPGEDLFAIEFVDLRDANGDIRKYRAIVVDGTLYPLHLAVSRRWKIHYFSADMEERAEHRAADAAFIADMRAAIGSDSFEALERVRDVLGLDYSGIDFALDAQGRTIVFEANASMIVPEPAAGAMWDYRRPAVARIHAAVRAMLLGRGALTV
jgi:tetratricopeptide (TPR) repeat protein